jgi:hypothetical protein
VGARNNNEATPKRLLFFRGYIVDKRLNEFRYIGLTNNGQPSIQFIPFTSRKGRKLLRAWTRARGRMRKR